MSQDFADKLFEKARVPDLSLEWPPVLSKDEDILFQGGFDLKSWSSKNVGFAAGLLVVVAVLAPLTNLPLGFDAIGYMAILLLFGSAVTFLMYRNQTWIITNLGIYIKGKRPVPFVSIKKITGFGSTVRFSGKFSLGASLIGVENASDIRRTLLGRPK